MDREVICIRSSRSNSPGSARVLQSLDVRDGLSGFSSVARGVVCLSWKSCLF